MVLVADRSEFTKQRIDYERKRKALPEGYPVFPVIPGKRYTDSRFYELEQKYLWNRTWLLAGHLDEIPLSGCYKRWDMIGKPIVLVRTRDGGVNAFHNSCRHRGALVARQPTGRGASLVCGYHGWAYDLDGALTHVQSEREFGDLDRTCRSLVPVRCELYGNLIYVNLDPDAPSLRDWLGPIWDEWTQFRLGELKLVHRQVWEVECNWKVAMEGNIEDYHLWHIHGDLLPPIYGKEQGNNILHERGHAVGITVCEGKVEWMAQNSPADDDPPHLGTLSEVGEEHLEVFNLFPNSLLSGGAPFHVNSPHFWPDGNDRCRFELYHMGLDWGPGERPAAWDMSIDYIHKVFEQDIAFTKSVWAGMQSPAFDGVLLGYTESRIYHWHQTFDEFVGRENVPEELRVEPVIGPEWRYPGDQATLSRLFGG